MSPQRTQKSLAQALMETSFIARLYESPLWRRHPLLVILLGITFRKEYQLVSRAMDLTRKGAILDLACGPGIYTRRLAREFRQGAVFGVDLSGPMLRRGNRLVQRDRLSNIHLVQANALILPFTKGHFDAVNCAAALHLFGDLVGAFSEVSRVLKPGGRFTFSTFRYPRSRLIGSFLSLRGDVTGIRSFRQEQIKDELQRDGFGEIRFLHAKGIWMVVCATKTR